MTRSSSMSSCFKCEKVFSLADQLKESMEEFEIFTMEMQFDLNLAKSKSTQVMSKFWQLISTIQSLKLEVGGKEQVEKDLDENQTSTGIVVSLEQSEAQSLSESLVEEKTPSKSESTSNPWTADKTSKMTSRQGLKQNSQPNGSPDFNTGSAAKRANELKRAKALLRSTKCETGEGFYNVFECLKCQRQFNYHQSGLRHVQNLHLNLGASCPTCSMKFFSKAVLELHISKCRQSKQVKKLKVRLSNARKYPMNLHLQPHEKQKQVRSTQNRHQNRNQKPAKTIEKQRGRPRKTFDPLKIKVNNPFPNFSLEKALSVKVVLERLKMQKSGKISRTSQTLAIEKFQTEPQNKKQLGQRKSAKTENKRRAFFL